MSDLGWRYWILLAVSIVAPIAAIFGAVWDANIYACWTLGVVAVMAQVLWRIERREPTNKTST